MYNVENMIITDSIWPLEQINKLAYFIIDNVPGEPSQSQGAVDTAIRIIQTQQAQIRELKAHEEQMKRALE